MYIDVSPDAGISNPQFFATSRQKLFPFNDQVGICLVQKVTYFSLGIAYLPCWVYEDTLSIELKHQSIKKYQKLGWMFPCLSGH